MEHDIAIKYISTLGFPIFWALAMGWVLFKIGGKLTEGHITYMTENTAEMKKQTKVLDEIKNGLPLVCNAKCENFQPRLDV